MRNGAPDGVVAVCGKPASARNGKTDSNAGNARHTPRPRKKRRRFTDSDLFSIKLPNLVLQTFTSFPSFTRIFVSRFRITEQPISVTAAHLERRALNDAVDQGARFAAVTFQLLSNFLDGRGVVIFHA